MTITRHRVLRSVAGLAALAALAEPAQAQRVLSNFPRSDQSDVAGVNLTSSDLVNWEPGTAKSFSCSVAWGVRTASESVESDLRAGGGSLGTNGTSSDLLILLTREEGIEGARERIVAALTAPGGSSRRAARSLVRSLEGLLDRTGQMDPADPGIAGPTQTNQAVSRYNDFVDASSMEYLQNQPAELRGIRTVLGRLVTAARDHDGRQAAPMAGEASGGLACAPPAPAPPPPPPPPPPVAFSMCMVQGSGPVNVFALRDATTGDTSVMMGGERRSLAAAYPATVALAPSMGWYSADEKVTVNGQTYVKYGLPRTLLPGSVVPAGEFGGVSVYGAPGVAAPGSIYLPVARDCVFHEYRREREVKSVRG